MQLLLDSDAAYLVAPKAKSRVAGYFYLSTKSGQPTLNAPIHVECALLKHVISSAAEAQTGVHITTREKIPKCTQESNDSYLTSKDKIQI